MAIVDPLRVTPPPHIKHLRRRAMPTFVQRLRGGANNWTHLGIDIQGELINSNGNLDDYRSKMICLHPPPGLCLLRRFAVAGLHAKEIDSALVLWVETSLPAPAEEYYLESWVIDTRTHGLAALPRALLENAGQKLQPVGARVGALRVPELRPPTDLGTGVVLWTTDAGLLACLWQNQILYDWQAFPPGMSLRPLLEQVAVCCRETPTFVHHYGMISDVKALDRELQIIWPHAGITQGKVWNPLETERHFGDGPRFTSYLHQDRIGPATGAEKLRLGMALVGTLAAVLLLFYANVVYLERQVEQLHRQVSLLKVQASRSENVAARSGEALRKIREIRGMTVERHGVMKVLKTLSNVLPPRVRLESVNLERLGTVRLDALAETELDISRFLENLGQTSLFRNPTLSFVEKEDKPDNQQPLVRFRLQMRLAQPLLQLPGEDQDTNQSFASNGNRSHFVKAS